MDRRKADVVFLLEEVKTPSTSGSTGGTRYNWNIIETVSKKYKVDVISINNGDAPFLSNVDFLDLKETRRFVLDRRIFNWKKDLNRAISFYEPGTIIVSTSATNALLAFRNSFDFFHVSIVQAYEDFGWQVPGGTLKERFDRARFLFFSAQGLSSALPKADLVIYNSEYIGNCLKHSFGCSLNGKLIYPPLLAEKRLRQYFNAQALQSVGFVNRAGKNIKFVIDLAKRCSELDFLIFGRIDRQIEPLPDNVKLKGWSENINDMYRQAQTWIMPSRWQEPFGMVAIEALSQGCRVGVSNRGGLPEAVGKFATKFDNFDLNVWQSWLFEPQRQKLQADLDLHLDQFSIDQFRLRVMHEFDTIVSKKNIV